MSFFPATTEELFDFYRKIDHDVAGHQPGCTLDFDEIRAKITTLFGKKIPIVKDLSLCGVAFRGTNA